jgi:formylglycine-generating enzyme required for sulfatase activity
MKRNATSLLLLAAAAALAGCAAHQPTDSARGTIDMVFIPGGSFVMGTAPEAGRVGFEISVDELPSHRARTGAFWIDRYEVTEKQYLDFLHAIGSAKYPGYWREAGRAEHYPGGHENMPVSDVDWFDAKAYCAWVGKRLPTEAEWEKAARGTDGRRWPWGDQFEAGAANTVESSRDWAPPPGQTQPYGWKAPVGSHRQDVSPYGVFDMAGNVKEWTESSYTVYPGNPFRQVSDGERFKVLRGGSYMTEATFARTAYRVAVLPTMGPSEDDGWHSDYTYGIRCAKDP